MRVEFDTVRQLEKKSFSVFAYAGGAFLVGLVMSVVALPMIGIPLMLISAVVVLGAIVWVSMLAREPARHVFCPYCTGKNDVFESRRRFSCNLCGRAVTLTDSGDPLAPEGTDVYGASPD